MENFSSIDTGNKKDYNLHTDSQNHERRLEMPIYMTRRGYQVLLNQREKLLKEMSEKKLLLGATAKADPDLPENAEFKALRVELMFTIPKQIADLDAKLAEAIIIEDSDENKKPEEVTIGTRVTLLIGDVKQSYYIGGAGETSVSDNVISYEAPLAQAILGACEGEERDFTPPRGSTIRIKVVSIARG